jgi:hypothetical protein
MHIAHVLPPISLPLMENESGNPSLPVHADTIRPYAAGFVRARNAASHALPT